jgi:hypothetical protein
MNEIGTKYRYREWEIRNMKKAYRLASIVCVSCLPLLTSEHEVKLNLAIVFPINCKGKNYFKFF